MEFADAAVAHGQGYSVLRIDVGLDTNALKEAVTLVMEKHKVHAFNTILILNCVTVTQYLWMHAKF